MIQSMFIESQIIKIRVLIYLNNNTDNSHVMQIAKTLDITKQRASKTLIQLEDMGYVDRRDNRNPKITEAGKIEAKRISERITVVLSYLLFEGLPLEIAEADAYRWAILNTEETMVAIRRKEKECRIKHALKHLNSFNGNELCKLLDDGKYEVEFGVYRLKMSDGQILSMANEGFEHPAILEVKNGKGKFTVKTCEIKSMSEIADRVITARATDVQYMYEGSYVLAEIKGSYISIPADALQFVNLGDNIHPTYHGSVGLKIKINIDTKYMPESEAMFTVII